LKRGALVWISLCLGVLAWFGTIGWITLLRQASLFNLQVLGFMLLGPLALLPAGILGRDRPLASGLWLLAGAGAAAAWLLLVIHGEGLGWFPLWEVQVPLAAGCLPAALLGVGFVVSGERTASKPALRTRGPLLWANGHALITAAVLLGAGILQLRETAKMAWTLTVTPSGAASRLVTVDARSSQMEIEKAFSGALVGIFPEQGTPRDGVLGRYELEGTTFAGRVHWIYDCRAEGDGKRVIVHRIDKAENDNEVDQDTFWNARLMSTDTLHRTVLFSRYESSR
jgi:hypothetical protein